MSVRLLLLPGSLLPFSAQLLASLRAAQVGGHEGRPAAQQASGCCVSIAELLGNMGDGPIDVEKVVAMLRINF